MLTTKKLIQQYDGTKWTNQLQNNQTGIEYKTAYLSRLTNSDRRCRPNRIYLFYPPKTVAYQN